MIFDGINLLEGSAIINATVSSGAAYPDTPSIGELFFRTDLTQLFVYDGLQWTSAGAGGSGTVTSVALTSANNAISVTGSPITSSGTLSITANTFSSSNPGVVPASGGGTTNFLRADGTWAVAGSGTVTSVALSSANGAISVTGSPITSNGTLSITANNFTSSVAGVVPASGGGTTNFLRADGTWSAPTATVTSLNATAANSPNLSTAPSGVYIGLGLGLNFMPAMYYNNTNATAGNRATQFYVNNSGTLRWELLTDAGGSPTPFFDLTRSGTTPTQLTLTANTINLAGLSAGLALNGSTGTAGQVLVSGGSSAAPTWSTLSPTSLNVTSAATRNAATTSVNISVLGGGVNPVITWMHSGATANSRAVESAVLSTGEWYVALMADNFASPAKFITVQRSGQTISSMTLSGTTINLTGLTGGLGINSSAGNAGQVLTSNGSAAAPTWTTYVPTTLAVTGTFPSASATGIYGGLNSVNGDPQFHFHVAGATSGQRRSTLNVSPTTGEINWALVNDANSSGTVFFTVDRNGTANTANVIRFTGNSFRLNGLTSGIHINNNAGTAGQVLTSAGGAAAPTWSNPSTAITLTTAAQPNITSVGTLTSLAVSGNVTSAEPTLASHLTTKTYVDNAVAGLTWKTAVSVATTANITLSGTQTIDGVAVTAGTRVLVKNQTTTSQNGVYVVAAGAWTRATDFDASPSVGEVNGAAVFVQHGTTQADTAWVQTATVTTIGTDAMTFVIFSATGGAVAKTGDTMTGRLGIGTTATVPLQVQQDISGYSAVFQSSGSSNQLYIQHDTTNNLNIIGSSGTSPRPLVFNFGATEMARFSGSTFNFAGTITSSGNLNLAQGISTASAGIEIGASRTADGTSYIDFWSHAAADYSARIIRSAGANGTWIFQNTGTGAVALQSLGGEIRLNTNNLDRMTITNSGSIGINTSNPRSRLDISNPTTASALSDLHFGYSEANFYGYRMANSNNPTVNAAGSFEFQRGTTSAWVNVWDCDNNGNGSWLSSFAIGANNNIATGPSFRVRGFGGDTLRVYSLASGNGISLDVTDAGETTNARVLGVGGNTILRVTKPGTGGNTHYQIANDNGVVGSITSSGTTTAYNTSSDERLKKNIVSAPTAAAKLNSIQVRSYDWKADDIHVEHGMIAQELHQVLPEAVKVGGEDVTTDSWAIDYSKLVPVLTKALQEVMAEVETLKAEVAALKAT